MPRLPGICQDCGAIYPSPLRAADSSAAPVFEVPAPCPTCGGSGAVPPDVLERVEGIHQLGDRLRRDEGARRELESLLEEAARPEDGGEPGDEEEAVLRARLRSRADNVCDGGERLVSTLPGFRAGHVRAWIRLLRLAAGAGHEGDAGPDQAPETPPADSEALLEAAYRRYGPGGGERGETGPEDRARRRLDGTGRNDSCPCGSGQKYKDCHWMEDLRATR